MLEPYAKALSTKSLADGYNATEKVIDAIKKLRALKVENNIAINVKPDVSAPADAKEFADIISKLAVVNIVFDEFDGIVTMTELGKFTLKQEKANKAELEKQIKAEIEKLDFEIKRSSGMLSNSNFMAKAPAKLVEAEKQKLENNTAKKAELEQKLKEL